MIEAIKEEITKHGQFSFDYFRRFWGMSIDTIKVIIKIRRIPRAKVLAELLFWYRYMRELESWYYKLDDHLREKRLNLMGNIAVSLANIGSRYTYCLEIPKDYFRGMRILDVGCGPVPYSLELTDCEIWGIDPLIDMYKRLNLPMDKYSDRYTVVSAPAESMPFEDNFFDAIISVNAIDHVDDLPSVAGEITRVLRPGGIFIFWAELHSSRLVEPWHIDDEIVKAYFGHLTIKENNEIPASSSSQFKRYYLVK